MSLVDPKNPSFWRDGTPRSQGNGFTNGFGEPVSWRRLQHSAEMRKASTKKVEKARATGKDYSTIHGISKKSDLILSQRRKYSPAVEGAEAGQRAGDKRAALRRGGI
ncbi:hypothetical protein J7E70_02055 [Variovorax paradoxus]|nr:hypothetical protein [Variovorax paradoxus]MBT2299238.1 hypothetical protein [Variovorax paradoxus]